MGALSGLSRKLIAWNKHTFGCIFERKKRVRRRLQGVIRALDTRQSMGMLKLEKRLKREWIEVLLQEELLWKQKSQVDWLRQIKTRNSSTRVLWSAEEEIRLKSCKMILEDGLKMGRS